MRVFISVVGLVSFLIALSFHEYAHAIVADILGDKTPRLYGRVSLNPLRHLDLIGVLAFFIFKIGWAKPVPVDSSNFKRPKRDMALVAIAGPTANIFLGILGLILGEIGYAMGLDVLWTSSFYSFATINILLAVFNLLPIPPLDGYKFLKLAIPDAYEIYFKKYETYGPILIILMFWVFDFGKLLIKYSIKLMDLLYVIFVKPILLFIIGRF